MFSSHCSGTRELVSLTPRGHVSGSLNVGRNSFSLIPAILVWWDISDLKKSGYYWALHLAVPYFSCHLIFVAGFILVFFLADILLVSTHGIQFVLSEKIPTKN